MPTKRSKKTVESEPHLVSEPKNHHEAVAEALNPLGRIYGEGNVAFAVQGWLHSYTRAKAAASNNVRNGSCDPQEESKEKYTFMPGEPPAKKEKP